MVDLVNKSLKRVIFGQNLRRLASVSPCFCKRIRSNLMSIPCFLCHNKPALECSFSHSVTYSGGMHAQGYSHVCTYIGVFQRATTVMRRTPLIVTQ